MDEYKHLLKQTVQVQVGIQETLKALNENIKSLNDKFILHTACTDEISKEVKAIRTELLKFLKWAIFVLVVVLGIFAGIKEIPKIL